MAKATFEYVSRKVCCRVLPFFEEQDVSLLQVLTDRGTEYCGNRECHEHQRYLAVENIDHSRTKASEKEVKLDGVRRVVKARYASWLRC